MEAQTAQLGKQLDNITKQVKNSHEAAIKLQSENESMAAKFEEARNQFADRDEEFKLLSIQLERERELYKAQLKEQGAILDETKKALTEGNIEKKKMLNSIKQLQNRVETYQDTVKNSQQGFTRLQKEFEKTTKHLTEMDKDRVVMRKKFDECRPALNKASETCSRTEAKITTLEKLCRQLQHERHHLCEQLKSHNIVVQPIPAYQAPSVPLTKKELEITKLRKELNTAQQNLKKLLATKTLGQAGEAGLSTQEQTLPQSPCGEDK